MKYIRTEDGVYPNEYPYQIDKRECLYEITCRIPFSTIEHGKVIKQADTIEELCDELVLIRNDLHLNEKTSNFEYAKRMAKQGFVVYGAIWTDKGLIYVAKMNDKGELELL